MQSEKNKPRSSRSKLIEMFLVLTAIAILAALAIPLNSRVGPSKIAQAKTEIFGLVGAINMYQTTYSGFPIAFTMSAASNDFTFGTHETSAAKLGITNKIGRQANNSEVMAALMDLEKFGNGHDSPNKNQALNPQRIAFINVRMRQDTKSPGVGLDGVYRDPWGNPYIITIDFNDNNKARDAFYSLAAVSEVATDKAEGLNSLVRPTPPPYNSATASNSFEAKARVMVWSLGPDGKADPTKKANEGVNKDNILSWW